MQLTACGVLQVLRLFPFAAALGLSLPAADWAVIESVVREGTLYYKQCCAGGASVVICGGAVALCLDTLQGHCESMHRTERGVVQVLRLFPSAAALGEPTWHSIVKIGQSLYREAPGVDPFRPDQATPVRRMFLAGSYTKQDYIDSMCAPFLLCHRSGLGFPPKYIAKVPPVLQSKNAVNRSALQSPPCRCLDQAMTMHRSVPA